MKEGVYEGYKVIVKGKGVIKRIAIGNTPDKGIDPDFDPAPYSVLGGNKPVLNVKVDVDATKRRIINGVNKFDRSKYMRVYSEPLREGPKVSGVIAEKGFLPGRQQFKFKGSLEYGFVEGQPKLKEDPNRPGYADPEFFKNYKHEDFTAGIEVGFAGYKDIGKYYPEDFKFAMCFDDWPSFMDPKVKGIKNERGTPDNYQAAAELAANVIEKQLELSGRTAHWWEVKNESDVGYEWMWHNRRDLYDSWGMLADFHNTMARVIKSRTPQVKIGGPTSAFMAYSLDNFRLARQHLKFMDDTKQNLDFYSHHFYESKGLISEDHLERTYLHGRLRSILDLNFNHMHLTNNFKPLVISEYGVLHDGPRDIDHWIVMKCYGAYMVQLMNQPDRIDMAVPFMMPLLWWYKGWKTGLFEYLPDDVSFKTTRQVDFLDFWKDYKGERIYSVDNHKNINTHSLVDGDTVYIAISNINAQRVSVDLNAQFGGAEIISAEYTRLYLDQGKLTYSKSDVKDKLKALPLSVDETTLLTVKLSKPVVTKSAVEEKMFFSDKTLQNTGADAVFTMKAETKDLQKAILRVSIGRRGGFNSDIKVDFNGEKFAASLKHTKVKGRYYGNVEFEIPVGKVNTQNTIKVFVPEQGGHIASAVLDATFTTSVQ